MRQWHHVAKQPEPRVEDLGVAGALRRAIVKQDHALGKRHRPGRPGDHSSLGQQRIETEQSHSVQEHRDVAACHRHRRDALELA